MKINPHKLIAGTNQHGDFDKLGRPVILDNNTGNWFYVQHGISYWVTEQTHPEVFEPEIEIPVRPDFFDGFHQTTQETECKVPNCEIPEWQNSKDPGSDMEKEAFLAFKKLMKSMAGGSANITELEKRIAKLEEETGKHDDMIATMRGEVNKLYSKMDNVERTTSDTSKKMDKLLELFTAQQGGLS